MGTVLDDVGGHVNVDVAVSTSGHPRVELTVREDDVRVLLVVSLEVLTTISSQNVTIVRGQSVLVLAVFSVSGLVEGLVVEHRVGAAESNGHRNLVACQDVPAITIEVTSSIGLLVVVTGNLTGGVEVNLTGSEHSLHNEGLSISHSSNGGLLSLLSSSRRGNVLESLATSVHRPCGHGLKERRIVRVVSHSHVSESIGQIGVQVGDVLFGGNIITGLEGLFELGAEGGGVGSEVNEVSVSLLDTKAASLIFEGTSEISGHLVGEGVLGHSGGTLKVAGRSRSGDGTLENGRVLHSEPGSEHTSVGASEDDNGGVVLGVGRVILDVVIGLHLLDQVDVVHHDVFDGQMSVVSLGQSYALVERPAFSEVSVLSENDKGSEVLGQSLGHETGVLIESPDVTLVSGVEQDGAELLGSRVKSLIKEVSIIDDVPH
mmetsp:Transcript_35029/g.53775  ORF Transcript_35029/g.53775 Transcript_35029/m.53775 type:complete len:431 (-) Transcript_35029:155-1447(-)